MSERSEVQDPLIRYAAEIGWTFIPRDEALTLRGGETGLFFGEVLAGQLRKLNPASRLTLRQSSANSKTPAPASRATTKHYSPCAGKSPSTTRPKSASLTWS
ncbi:MAG: hypothetical protein ACRDH2_05075 [Anaerolineales bacterium]